MIFEDAFTMRERERGEEIRGVWINARGARETHDNIYTYRRASYINIWIMDICIQMRHCWFWDAMRKCR